MLTDMSNRGIRKAMSRSRSTEYPNNHRRYDHAAVARELNSTVDVIMFRTWQPEHQFETPFMFSAAAFYWIEPSVRHKECLDLLEVGGYMARLWNVTANKENPIAKRLLISCGGTPLKKGGSINRKPMQQMKENRRLSTAACLP